MKLIGLPGRNQETEAWLRELFGLLALGDCEVVRYRHWSADAEPDVTHEAEGLRNRTADLVIAKSMGTIVTTAAHSACSFRPSRAVLIGSPVAHLAPEMLARYRDLAEQIPTLFIQQSADFTGTFAQLMRIVGDCKRSDAYEVPGADHVYSDTAELASIIRAWLGRGPFINNYLDA